MEDAQPAAEARLRAYEGPGYVLRSKLVRLEAGGWLEAGVFLPCRSLPTTHDEWDLASWQRTAKPRLLRSWWRAGRWQSA